MTSRSAPPLFPSTSTPSPPPETNANDARRARRWANKVKITTPSRFLIAGRN
jgi:hypothetical protein